MNIKQNDGKRYNRGHFGPMTILKIMFIIGLITTALIVTSLIRCVRNNSVHISTNHRIDITPSLIKSIKDIGEWEFLSVSDEEMVDTVRQRLFANDQLVRIYYGTLRLGVDMQEMGKNSIVASGDFIVITLPPIKILDQRFIDETRTKSFLEKGEWTHSDRAALYKKAHDIMTRRCLNEQNLKSAQQNADTQIRKILQAMGYDNVKVIFQKTKE